MKLLEFNPDLLPKDDFSVAITGNRHLDEKDYVTIQNTISELVTNPNVKEIYFGGAVGADTVALEAAIGIVCINKPQLIVVVPDTLERQPAPTHAVSKRADRLTELHAQITILDGWRAFHARNEYMVDHAAITVAFWDKQPKGGTYACIRYSINQGKNVYIAQIIGYDK